jgi:HD domain
MSAGNLGGEEVVAPRRWQPNGPGGVADLRPDPRLTGASELTSSAYAFARDADAGQRHEVDGSPYIEHPVAVGQLLYLAGCSEEVVAAGLLHDTVEHTDVRIEEIERRFGPAVARLVAANTEPADVHPFAVRKEALRRQVADAGYDAETIFAADKVVSTQTLRRAIADQGEAQVRQRLTNPLEDKVEHYRNTLGLLDEVAESLPLVPLLREELEELAREHQWQARLETINRLFEGFNRRAVAAVLELCDPEVRVVARLHEGRHRRRLSRSRGHPALFRRSRRHLERRQRRPLPTDRCRRQGVGAVRRLGGGQAGRGRAEGAGGGRLFVPCRQGRVGPGLQRRRRGTRGLELLTDAPIVGTANRTSIDMRATLAAPPLRSRLGTRRRRKE